ncbi:GAF domain-containing protein [Gordonia soli]|uniref:GAF domain-containing protein n=1 Tax=Gordonia soli NBRC 108243 TaxID=1223545 RepID=M0QJ97_9ACTN|nr:GAF domain-containing protein [Gordonia soli]GAC68638.1 hypothetical protein GS4_17_00240 [Gordonia soli NBRC 108243]
MGYSILPSTDLAGLAGDIANSQAAILTGGTPVVRPPEPIVASWKRAQEAGLAAERHAPPVIGITELDRRRAVHPLTPIIGSLQRLFEDSVDDAQMMMGIFDAEGLLLWRGGSRRVLSLGESLTFVEGSQWDEPSTATTAISLVIEKPRPLRVFGAEHYSRPLHDWYCAAAPIHDPRTGDLLGIVDLSGPALSWQPSATMLANTIATIGEHELSRLHLGRLADLRSGAAPQLAAIRGPALVVDEAGWVADSRGVTAPRRVATPAEGDHQFVPGMGMCISEPVGEGWLIRPVGPVNPVRAELDLRGEPTLVVGGDEEWRTVLTRRHAQILLLLSRSGESGLTAAALSHHLFGDGEHLVTVRAEMSRLRRAVGALVASRPYRLAPGVSLTMAADSDESSLEVTDALTPVRDDLPEPPRRPRGGRHQRPA